MLQRRQQAQQRQRESRHLISADVKLGQLFQRSERIEAVIVDTAEAHVQRLQLLHLSQMLKYAAGDLAAAQIQILQVLPLLQERNAAVADVLAVVAIEIGDVLQRPQMLQAQIADLRIREIQLS